MDALASTRCPTSLGIDHLVAAFGPLCAAAAASQVPASTTTTSPATSVACCACTATRTSMTAFTWPNARSPTTSTPRPPRRGRRSTRMAAAPGQPARPRRGSPRSGTTAVSQPSQAARQRAAPASAGPLRGDRPIRASTRPGVVQVARCRLVNRGTTGTRVGAPDSKTASCWKIALCSAMLIQRGTSFHRPGVANPAIRRVATGCASRGLCELPVRNWSCYAQHDRDRPCRVERAL